MKDIVLVGGGGHCKVIIDIIESRKEYNVIGIVDNNQNLKDVLSVPVLGNDNILEELYDKGISNAFVCIGALGNIDIRNKVYNKLKKIGFKIPKLIHKNSYISSNVSIGEGTCVMAGVIINPDSQIGENCIINTGAIIEHDCIVSDNVHVSPGVKVGGGVKISYNTHIGIGSTIIQGVTIGNNVIIGAGSVVVNDFSDNILAFGVPAKKKN
ncbi:acetyltransferase [Clostridium manihotivorum]|uniref:Serine acetyltransferase n=1 Tax=Clostridium manihotivorum TaxID=2320868 RepID=A0A410DRG2_9CLOT|nr:acetyltransferase [Clostridium manihotivorum]QAA31669.1 serine acetyltransferase [Clostridium manihotivorum]